jgi:RNA polymerase sigma-70 factor (ECF subfamily)
MMLRKKIAPLATISNVESAQDHRYRDAAAEFGAALERLARAYEFDPDRRRDLLQEIHLALWRSFAGWNAQCSLRTWVYRVAHNAAASHVIRERRMRSRVLVSLEELESAPDPVAPEAAAGDREGLDAASISEITGLSAGNVATKIHRIKSLLARQFHQGANHAN